MLSFEVGPECCHRKLLSFSKHTHDIYATFGFHIIFTGPGCGPNSCFAWTNFPLFCNEFPSQTTRLLHSAQKVLIVTATQHPPSPPSVQTDPPRDGPSVHVLINSKSATPVNTYLFKLQLVLSFQKGMPCAYYKSHGVSSKQIPLSLAPFYLPLHLHCVLFLWFQMFM